MLQAAGRRFYGAEDGAVRAIAAFLAQEFDQLIEAPLGFGSGSEETFQRQLSVFLDAGFIEQTEFAAEAELEGETADDTSEEAVHRSHGKPRQRGREVAQPLRALVRGELRIAEFPAEAGQRGGIACRFGEAPKKFLQEFGCGLAGEGEGEDPIGSFAAGQQFEATRHQAVSFAAAGIGHDKQDAGQIFHDRPSKAVMVPASKTSRGCSPPNHSAKLS